MKPTAIIAALPEEVSALRGRLRDRRRYRTGGASLELGRIGSCPVAIAVVGDGARNARQGTRALLEALPVERALLIGVSAALSPELGAAELVVARAVIGEGTADAPAELVDRAVRTTGARRGLAVSVPDLLETPEDKARLRGALPDELLVADLESAAVVERLAAVGIPWNVLRAVSDTAAETIPSFVRRCRDEHGLQRTRLVAAALRAPAGVSDLWRMAARMRACALALALAVERLLVPA